jgi:hypothetical protein
MRGIVPVVSFAVIGGAVIALGYRLATHPVFCSGDMQGISPTNTCGQITHDDISFAVSAFGASVVALFALLVVSNGVLSLARRRRSGS